MKKFTRDRVVPDDLRERLLRQLRQHALRLVRLAVTRQEQERARQPLFTRVEQLIDEVLLDPNVPREHVREKPVRERRLVVQHPGHVVLRDGQQRRGGQRPRRCHTARLAREAPFAEERAGVQDGDDGLLAAAGQHRQLHAPLLDVQNRGGRIALREDDRRPPVFGRRPGHIRRAQELVQIERRQRRRELDDFGATAHVMRRIMSHSAAGEGHISGGLPSPPVTRALLSDPRPGASARRHHARSGARRHDRNAGRADRARK